MEIIKFDNLSKTSKRRMRFGGTAVTLLALTIGVAFAFAAPSTKNQVLSLQNASVSGNAAKNGDKVNFGNATSPTTSPTPTTTPPTTPTTQVTTTTMNHGSMGGNASDNVALEQFRSTDPSYNRYKDVPSAQLPLNVLTKKSSPSSSIFHPEITGRFRTACDFSHLAYDDPIMKPNQPGKSHLHMFYGNTGTNGNSTSDSIINSGGSTCDGNEANRTAYWFPTVHDAQGRVRLPSGMVVYYKTEGVPKPAGGYADIPQGLKLIAGNASATAPQAASYNNGWGCGNMFINPNSALIPNCANTTATGEALMLKVHFPRCWDGSFDFDPTQPQKHVAYEVGGKCPTSNPIAFTGITVLFDWDLNPGETTAGWYLSSDRMNGVNKPGGTTMHGDWFNGWHKDVMNSWNQNCSNTSFDCSNRYLGLNGQLPGVPAGGVNELVQTKFKQSNMTPNQLTLTIPPRTNT